MKRVAVVAGIVMAASAVSPIAPATARTADGLVADLSVSVTGPAEVTPGERATYQLTIRNAGPDAVDAWMSATWSRTLAVRTYDLTGVTGFCGWPLGVPKVDCPVAGGPIAPGDSRIVTVSGTVDPQAVGSIDVTGEVKTRSTDPATDNNTDTTSSVVRPSA